MALWCFCLPDLRVSVWQVSLISGYFFVSYLLTKCVNFNKKISVHVQSFLHIHARLNYVIEPDWKQTQATAHLKLKKESKTGFQLYCFSDNFGKKFPFSFSLLHSYQAACIHTARGKHERMCSFFVDIKTLYVCVCVLQA